MDGKTVTFHLSFSVADSVEIKDLSMRIPKEAHVEWLDAVFKGVPIR